MGIVGFYFYYEKLSLLQAESNVLVMQSNQTKYITRATMYRDKTSQSTQRPATVIRQVSARVFC